MDTSGLFSECAPDAKHERLRAPWSVEWQGRKWTAVTNGQAMALVAPDGVSRFVGHVPHAIPDGPAIDTTTHTELLAWADPGDGNARVTSQASVAAPAPASMHRRVIDRRLLWRYLRHLPPCAVEIRGDKDALGMLRFDGDGWVLLLMPMRYAEPEKAWR